ncbi:MAG TPA: hypothetical protein VGW39_01660 [Chthoniobacterales bacterium]|nr:hypothetical protein [Chthoniobacterales bacterium]
MNGLTLNAAGTNRIFRPDGTVAVGDAAGNFTEKGTWVTVSDPDANKLHYTFDGQNHEMAVRYSFNDKNQLVAVIPASENSGADSQPFTFPGKIVIDDSRDVVYKLLSEAGDETDKTIVVHGVLSLKAGLDQLSVALPDGTSTAILGDKPISLIPGRNDFRADALDRIRFSATTTNTFDGDERDAPAVISFVGDWSLDEDGLAFNAQVAGEKLAIRLGAKYKGVTAGLAYYAKDGDKEIAFVIAGRHKFKSGSGEGSVNWSLFLGHSGKELDARLEVATTKTRANGDKLSLVGKLGVAGKQIDLEINAKYEMGENGELTFRADFGGENGPQGYNLMLEGKYQVRGGVVTFVVEFDRNNNKNSLSLNLTATFSNDKVKVHLTALLKRTDRGTMDLQLNFDVSMRWVDGKLIQPDKPVLAQA